VPSNGLKSAEKRVLPEKYLPAKRIFAAQNCSERK
jgi:hypothetical protein